ncbi:MAG: hypothetical protein ACJ787_12340 [Myxococcales bacterium]
MNALAARLEGHAQELVRESLEAMYGDPFWLDRFGERGRDFARADGLYHLTYLATALSIGGTGTLENYARWLQTVLTTRGMCTLHIEENFARLAEAIRARGLDEQGVAQHYLAAASAALRYRGSGKGLQAATSRLAAKAAEGMSPDRLREAMALSSFLADAVALSMTTSFVGHVAWLRAHHARTGAGADFVPRLLERLAGSVRELPELTGEERAAALQAISAAAASR